MNAFRIQKIAGSLLVAIALTTGCSRSNVTAEDKATADGQAGGVGGGSRPDGTNRLGATVLTLEAVSLPDGLSMSLVEIPENEARLTVSNIVSGLPKKSTYAGSFKVNGSGSLNGQTVIVALGFTKLELQFPAAPELTPPVTVSLFDGRTVAASLGLTSQISTVSVMMACANALCGAEVPAKPSTSSPAGSSAPTPNICETCDSVTAFLEGCIKSESAAVCTARTVGQCGGGNTWVQEKSDSAQKGLRFGFTLTTSSGKECEITAVAGVDKDPTAGCNRIEMAQRAKKGDGFEKVADIAKNHTNTGDAAGCGGCHTEKKNEKGETVGWAFFEVGAANEEMGFGANKIPPLFGMDACNQIAALGPKDCKSQKPASKALCDSFDAIVHACRHAATPTKDLSKPLPSSTPLPVPSGSSAPMETPWRAN